MDNVSIRDLDVVKLSKLKKYSLYMRQWGYFIGFIVGLCSVCSLLAHGNIIVSSIGIAWSVSHFYIYTMDRTETARIFVLVESLLGVVGLATSIVCSSVFLLFQGADSGAFLASLILPVILFLISAILLLAAREKMLWGKNRVTYKQVKFLYDKKLRGIEFTDDQLPPNCENNRICDKVFIVIACCSELLLPVFFIGLFHGSFSF